MTIAQITKDHQLQIEKKFHKRTTVERLEAVEHMLKRILFNTSSLRKPTHGDVQTQKAETKEKANSRGLLKQRRRSSLHF